MKALVQNGFGGVETMVLTELPIPNIGNNEVLIKVKAISLNPVDVRTRAGSAMAEHLKHYDPLILGWDISGTVAEIGSDVSKFKIGDDVFGLINFLGHGKGYADYVAAADDQIVIKPSNISHSEAAGATLAALTAWQLLNDYAGVKKGDRVLILAASGGFGHYAAQVAKYLGAHVIGVSSARNSEFVLDYGADEHIAYDEVDFENVVTDADIVVDAFSGDSLYSSLKAVRSGGKIISMLPFISDEIKDLAREKGVDIHYSMVKSDGEDMQIIADLLEKGILRSHISKKFPFHQMGDAHLEVEGGHTVGKIVVIPEY